MSKPISESNRVWAGWKHLFAALSGIFIAVGLLKFGNPVVLADKIQRPTSWAEWLYQAWPLEWAYFAFLPLLLAGIKVTRWKFHPILLLPLTWLIWQFVSATQTINPMLTALTLKHFTACVICFYLGWFALSEVEDSRLLWIGILLGFAWVIRSGFEQQFGGLEASRRYFEMYVLPTLQDPPVDLIKKMQTNRIFSTLFYPNTLAGVILLLLPVLLVTLWQFTEKLARISQMLIVGAFGCAALACLFWSGSKSGWILMLLLAIAWLLFLPLASNVKRCLLAGLVLAGTAGFFIKYAGFFEKGATSVVARTDYWRAAVQIFQKNPVMGTGPGTFSNSYEAVKPPGAEMARLCHNDYLEQASDSGTIGFLAYFGWILGCFFILYRKSSWISHPLLFAVGLGLAAVNLQSLSEFHLYIPGLAWPNFLLLGFLVAVAQGKPLDKKTAAR